MIYILILLLLLLLAFHFDFNNQKGGESFCYLTVLLILIALSGFRYKVGGDTLAYFDFFKDYPFVSDLPRYDFANSKWDPFWVILSSISKSIVNDFTFFQFLHAIILNIIFFRFVSKYTPFRFTAILIYFIFFYIYFNTEIMRESLAICFFLLAYPFLKEKKWIRYYALAIVAFLFHSSAIIIFIFPLFRNIRIDKKSIVILIIGFVILNAILNYFPTIIQTILFSERLSNRFETYSEFKTDINGMLNIFFYYAFLPYLVVALNNKVRRRKQLFEELHMLYFVLVMIVVSISGFARMLNYLTPFMIIYFADFLNTVYQRRTFSQLSGQVVFVILLVSTIPKIRYYNADTSKFYNGTHRYNLYYPYTSVFTKEEYRFRDIIFREGQKESLNRD